MSGHMLEDNETEQPNIILFKRPVPPCRVPVRKPDGRLVLDFPSEAARAEFKQRCITKVEANCQQGARATCSLKAIDKCRGPQWLRWLGLAPRKTWQELEACEEEAMQACTLASQPACKQHAEQFCEIITRPPK